MTLSPLVLANGGEGLVLEPPYGSPEQLKVHDDVAQVVLADRFGRVLSVDVEVGDAPAVDAGDLDAIECVAAGQGEGAEEKIVGADHSRPPSSSSRVQCASYDPGSWSRTRRPVRISRLTRRSTAYQEPLTWSCSVPTFRHSTTIP